MFGQVFRHLVSCCMYQPMYQDTYSFLAKGMFLGNIFWLLGDMISSRKLGIGGYVSELLMFYLFFLLILSFVSTMVVKRFVFSAKLSLTETVTQCRSAFFFEIVYSGILFAFVSTSCLLAALSRAFRSLPALGYLFRETYEGIEPLFMIGFLLVFVLALALPLISPFILLLVKKPLSQWSQMFHKKIKPRCISSLIPLAAASLLWFILQGMKCFVEWNFPVQGFLSLVIRAALYTPLEVLVFWPCLKCFLDVARTKNS